jgi:hypothetical protein
VAAQYLIVSGAITEDGALELAPGFITSQPPLDTVSEASPDALVVESRDAADTILHREAIATAPLCLRPVPTLTPRLVSGLVAFTEGTKLLRFIYQGEVVREIEVPDEPPVVELQWQLGDEVGGVQMLTWEAAHPRGLALAYVVLYAHAPDAWRPVSLVLRDNVVPVDFDALPGGQACQIRVLASDGVNTAIADSPPFRVALKGVEPLIVEPDEGATVPAGNAVLLQGLTLEWEGGSDETIPLRWRSSIDGDLGEGGMIDATLSPGTHVITLTAGEREAFVNITAQPAALAFVPP